MFRARSDSDNLNLALILGDGSMSKFISVACLTLVASALLATLSVDAVTAAPKVGTAKARGDYSNKFWGSAGGRSVRHARDYSGGYRTYARQAPTITREIAQHEAAGVGQNITAAQKQFSELRNGTTDKQVLTSLDSIDKQLAVASKAHAKMHEMCQMETIDAEGTMKCCDDVEAALDKVIAEHKEFMKRLEGEPAAPAPSN
jgi:hypothetical protein